MRRERDLLSRQNEESENQRKKTQRELEALLAARDELHSANSKLEKTKKRLNEEVGFYPTWRTGDSFRI